MQRALSLVLGFGLLFGLIAGCNSLIGAGAPNIVDSLGGASGAGASSGAPTSGQDCVLATECPGTQICLFRQCSKPCAGDKDCQLGRCLQTGAGTACVIPSIATCTSNAGCPEGSVCKGKACRNACSAGDPCLADQTCIGGVCVGSDVAHDPDAASGGAGNAGSSAGGSSGNGAIAGDGPIGDGGAGGAAPECEPTDVDCNGLTPIACQAGKLARNGADCAFVCKAGKCAGECKVGDKRCTGLLFEECQPDNTWKPTSCTSVCDASQGCVGNCTVGTLQCNGATELDECKAGSYQLKQACPVACAKVSGVAKCVACGDADGLCPVGCKSPADTDCPKEPGEACGPTDQCKTGLCAGEGVCCDKACGGCNSCKLPGKVGTCSPIDYSKSADKSNCGSCGNACSTTNITASCSNGVCGGTCAPGFAHCSAASNVGCETNTSNDPANCGGCGTTCKYGSCVGSVCKFSKVGPGPDANMTMKIGFGASLFAMPLGGIAAGKVAALGLLATVDGVNNKSVNVYIALYADSNGVPSTLVAETDLLTTVDAGAAPTEGLISPPVAFPAGSYWLVIMISNTIRLHTTDAATTSNWYQNSQPVTFAKLTGTLPGFPQSVNQTRATMYAVTTP